MALVEALKASGANPCATVLPSAWTTVQLPAIGLSPRETEVMLTRKVGGVVLVEVVDVEVLVEAVVVELVDVVVVVELVEVVVVVELGAALARALATAAR